VLNCWWWTEKLSETCIVHYLTNWPSCSTKFCFTISFISCLYMFRAHVLETCRGTKWKLLCNKFCASSWLITEINILRRTVSKTSKKCIFLFQKYRVIKNDCRGHTQYTPDATPCDFFQRGYFKDQVYVPPLPASTAELKVRIRTAIQTVTADMLQTVWNELDYRVDVCRITNGAHIEHL